MQVEFNVRDFLDRAAATYPERVAVVDEPDQPAEPWAPADLRRAGRAGPGPGRRARPPGHRPRRTGGGRVPQLGPAADVVLRGVAAGGGSWSPSTSGWPGPRSSTSSSTRAPRCCWSTPSSTRRWPVSGPRGGSCSAPDSDAELYLPGSRAGSRGTSDESATATINYTSGTTARPKGVQLTHRNCWVNAAVFGWHVGVSRPRRLPAHPAHVPRQRLGHALDHGGHGRDPGGPAQGRRARDPAPGRSATA